MNQQFEDSIVRDIQTRTSMTYAQIGEKYGVNKSCVSRIAYKRGVQRIRGAGSPAHPKSRTKKSKQNESNRKLWEGR